MQTRNQKSIKFSVFTNSFVFCSARVYVGSIWSEAQFPFAFISSQSAAVCGPGLAFCTHCTLALGASQSIEFWSVSECEWIQSSTFLLSKVQVQSQRLCGGGSGAWWWSEVQYHNITGPASETSLSSHSQSLLHDHRTHPPIPGQKLISSLWELPTTKYSNWNRNNKQTQRGETGSKMCTVIYQAGAGESCVLSPSVVVFTITKTNFPLNERRSQPFDLARTICILFLPDSAAFFLHWGCSKFALRVSLGGAES